MSLLSVELPHGTCCTSLQAPKHTVIIGSCFRVAVPVEEKEVAVTVNSNSFCTPAPFQHSVKCFIYFFAHWNLTNTAFRFGVSM